MMRSEGKEVPWTTQHTWRVLSAACVTATLLLGIWGWKPLRARVDEYEYERRLGLSDVLDAVRDVQFRTIAARLAGRFPYRPMRYVARGSNETLVQPVFRQTYAAAAVVAAKTATAADADALHALGIAHLVAGNPRLACRTFERAATSSSGEPDIAGAISHIEDARLLADLAAAYYELGVAEKRTEAILTAVDAAERAHKLDGGFAAAAFTRALAVEKIHTAAQAKAAWDDYLRIDPSSGWAVEARAHSQALSRPDVAPIPVDLRATKIEAELLPAWGDAFSGGEVFESERVLASAGEEAAALAACCGDDFHRRAVDIVARAAKGDRHTALILAAAHQQYRDGRRLYAENNTSAAVPLLRAARGAFRDADDVFALKPWKYLAASYLYLGDGASCITEAEAAARFCVDVACTPAALAHIRWVQAMAAGRAGNPQRALEYYKDALRGFEQGNEIDNAASIHALIAENLEFLGAGEEAWPHRQTSLRAAERSGTLDRVYIAFNEAADAALRRGHLASARAFQDVVVDAARQERNTALLADALLWRGRIKHAAGDREARDDWLEAERLADRVDDPQRRARLRAGIAAARAEASAPAEAVEQLTRAIGFFITAENHYRLADLYAARAEAEEKLGQRSLAEGDFLGCITELEAERSEVADAELRERYFASGSRVFDRAIRHVWIGGRRDDAFTLAEQSRGREVLGPGRPASMTPRGVLAGLRAGDTVLEYAVLEDRLVIWVVGPSRSIAVERPLSARALNDAIAAQRAILDGDGNVDQAIDRLSALLFAPIAAEVRGAKRLVIVANKTLRSVPFAALRDPSSRKYLIETYEIVVAPSAAAYLRAVQQARTKPRRAVPSVLLASYTAGDASRGLAALPLGAAEVDSLRGVYQSARILSDAEARPSRLLSEARNAELVHVVAHTVENEEHPEYASVILAPSTGGRDLYARDIAAASFPLTRLVFLSSCGTPGNLAHNDAPLTLPESFLAAGVPLVIGALRAVDDAATAEFAVAFHRAFLTTGDGVAALRRAQMQLLASPKRGDVRFWSSWIAVGGGA